MGSNPSSSGLPFLKGLAGSLRSTCEQLILARKKRCGGRGGAPTSHLPSLSDVVSSFQGVLGGGFGVQVIEGYGDKSFSK